MNQMNRSDSGFDEFSHSEDADSKSRSGRTSNTEPTENRPHISSESSQQSTATGHPTSEKRRRRRNTSSGPRRKSTTTSSSEHSTKSHGRGNGSKPSSRRTSCTLVDPSRRARHYRIKSTQTVSSVNRDVDDVLALHFRSCTLFQNPPYQSGQSSATRSQQRVADGQVSPTQIYPVLNFAPEAAAVHSHPLQEADPQPESEKATGTSTEIHWTSPSTRRRQYEKMDKAHSGLRGVMRKVFPKCCVPGPAPPKFYDENKSDSGSVRRFRLDLPDDEDEDDLKGDNEKMITLSSEESPRRATSRSKAATAAANTKPRRRWSCF